MKLISRVVFVNKTSVLNNNYSAFYNLRTKMSGQSYGTFVKQIVELQYQLFVKTVQTH